MRIVDLVSEDLILPRLRGEDGPAVIRELSSLLAERHPEVREEEAARVLVERERLGSTAVRQGLAIPHAKLESISRLIGCFGRSRKGVDFGSHDGEPTHFFFVLLAPETAPGAHLKALARISRLFRNPDFYTRLTAAETARDMYDILAAEDGE